jgi:Tfp pilus assembly protein PilX
MAKKGVALLLALLTLLIVSLLLITFLELATIDLQITSNLFTRHQALYIADAGIEDAVSILRGVRSGFTRTINFPSPPNKYSVTYLPITTTFGIITSTGTLATGEQVVLEAKVSVVGSSSPYKVKIISWREL